MILYKRTRIARFLQKCISCKIQETQPLQKLSQKMRKWCKIIARIWQDLLSNSPILQDMYFLQEFYKSCIDCKNFATFLQKLFSCELGFRVEMRHDYSPDQKLKPKVQKSYLYSNNKSKFVFNLQYRRIDRHKRNSYTKLMSVNLSFHFNLWPASCQNGLICSSLSHLAASLIW